MAKTKKQPEEKVEKTELEKRLDESGIEYLGEGPLSGEYRFTRIAGSVSASSKEDAFEKVIEIATKHPSLLSE